MTAEEKTTKMKFSELLIKLNACKEAREWASDMFIEEIVKKCHRGDWLLWIALRVNVDKRKLTLAKAYCANTVRHLMKDERSINAIDVAIRYGNGQATDEELNTAAYAAYAYAAYADAADDAAADARNKVRMETADIFRQYIGNEIIQKVNELL